MNMSNCGMDVELLQAVLEKAVHEMVQEGRLQEGLVDCKGSNLGQGSQVALCSNLELTESELTRLIEDAKNELMQALGEVEEYASDERNDLKEALKEAISDASETLNEKIEKLKQDSQEADNSLKTRLDKVPLLKDCQGELLPLEAKVATCRDLNDAISEVEDKINQCPRYVDCQGQPICEDAAVASCRDLNDAVRELKRGDVSIRSGELGEDNVLVLTYGSEEEPNKGSVKVDLSALAGQGGAADTETVEIRNAFGNVVLTTFNAVA